MRKGEIVEQLEIESVSSDGKGVGRKNGQVIFVKGTVPGDVLNVSILKSKKNYMEATSEVFHSFSKDRADSFCEHFGLCGGCKWQHMDYVAQLRFKQDHVEENLKKLSGLKLPRVQPILGSEKTTFYRNKLEYTFSNFKWLTKEEINSSEEHVRSGLGFHLPGRFDKILNINMCFLQPYPSNEIRIGLKKYADKQGLEFFDLKRQSGFLRNLIIRTATTGDLMVILQVFQYDEEKINEVMSYLKNTFSSITSLMYVVNAKGNDTFHDLEVILFHGKDHIIERMGSLQFRIGPQSFYQTNSDQAHKLYKVASNFANLKGHELIYDLYTGTGTIANFLAKSAKKVIGIEYMEDAIKDAKINSALNDISNTEFFAGDMKNMLRNDFIHTHGRPSVIITDPPRAGMHPRVTQLLTDQKVDKLVYVSCNPATQARDLQILGASYVVEKIQPVDMFPHTQHVENVVLLKSK